MVQNSTQCPDRQHLKQFVLGQLSLSEVEDFEHHLSHCDPCIETVNGLQISDTFTDVTRQAWPPTKPAPDQSGGDDELIEQMMHDVEGWSVANRPTNQTEPFAVTAGKSAEVQNLLREPQESGDLGAVAHFRLIELIGAGSTGVVYRGVDTKLDRDVVIKILRSSLGEAARQRFVTEAKSTAAIDHANVVTIYEVGSDGPLSYIAMQWLPGQTLEQCLAQCESLPLEHTKKLAIEIASGLAAAHQKGLIHRDIKPANIWIPDNDGPAKILDFGLVRVNDEDPQLTCTGMIAGTPCFMSPEQSRGDTLDARSDLFSLGCLIYQCLTGQLPFRGDNALATLRSIQQVHPTHPRELDPTIDSDMSDLTMCLLAKSPARRPDSAETLVASLQTESRQWPFELVNESHIENPQAASRGTRSSFWKTVAALLVGIGMASLGFAYGQQIVRIATNQGEIVIDTSVDDVQIEVSKEGEFVQIIDLATQNSIEITAGEYQLRPVGDENSISIDKNTLTLSRGEKEIVKITRTATKPSADAPTHNQGIQSAVMQQRLGGPVAKSPKSNSTEPTTATDIQTNNQRDSVYKEKTYTQWLQTARTDRDAASLILACKGIANLASGDQVPEMLEAVVQIARRGPGLYSADEKHKFHSVVVEIFKSQPAVTKLQLFTQELRLGNKNSQNYFFGFYANKTALGPKAFCGMRNSYSFDQPLETYSSDVSEFLTALNEHRIADKSRLNSRTDQSVAAIYETLLPWESDSGQQRNAEKVSAWGLESNSDIQQIIDDYMQSFSVRRGSDSFSWIAKYFASKNVVNLYLQSLEEIADGLEKVSKEHPGALVSDASTRRAISFFDWLPKAKRPLDKYIDFGRRVFPMTSDLDKMKFSSPLGIQLKKYMATGLPELRNGQLVIVSLIEGDCLQGELEVSTEMVNFKSIGFEHPEFFEKMVARLKVSEDFSQFEFERDSKTGQFTIIQKPHHNKYNLMESAFRYMDRTLRRLIKDDKKNKTGDATEPARSPL